jgi:serine/threonine protein kinase
MVHRSQQLVAVKTVYLNTIGTHEVDICYYLEQCRQEAQSPPEADNVIQYFDEFLHECDRQYRSYYPVDIILYERIGPCCYSCLVMEKMDSTVEDTMQGEPLPLAEAKDLSTQVLWGLAFLYNHVICHRDLRASNVMLTSSRDAITVKICDFGDGKSSCLTTSACLLY